MNYFGLATNTSTGTTLVKNIGVKKKNKHIIMLWDHLIDIKIQNIEILFKRTFQHGALGKTFQIVDPIQSGIQWKWAIQIIFKKLEHVK